MKFEEQSKLLRDLTFKLQNTMKKQQATQDKKQFLIQQIPAMKNLNQKNSSTSAQQNLMSGFADSTDRKINRELQILINFLFHEGKEEFHTVKMNYNDQFLSHWFMRQDKVKNAFLQLANNYKSRYSNVLLQKKMKNIVNN